MLYTMILCHFAKYSHTKHNAQPLLASRARLPSYQCLEMKTKRLFSHTAKCNEQRKTMNVKNQPSALSQHPYATYVEFIYDNVQNRLPNTCIAATTETILETQTCY